MHRRLAHTSVAIASLLVGCNVLSGVGDLRLDRDGGAAGDSTPAGADAETYGGDGSTTPPGDADTPDRPVAVDGAPVPCKPSGVVERATATPGIALDDPRIGALTWSNPDGARLLGGQSARATLSSNIVTHWLLTAAYGFTIPIGATVRGIVVTVVRTASFPDEISDHGVAVVKAGNPGVTKAMAGNWSITQQTVTYGTPGDTWGTTWTPELVNAKDFGAALAVHGTMAFGETASVDHIEVTVHFERCVP